MFRYTLRRLLWTVPTLMATSVILFFITTLVGASGAVAKPASDAGSDSDPYASESRDSRFLDLPRFLNVDPKDVRARAREALTHVAAGDSSASAAALELCALGGAALPYVLPQLETLAPAARGQVAAQLAPVAIRMGLGGTRDLRRPETAVLFWTRF